MGIPDQLTCLLSTCLHVKKQQLELDTEQWTGSKFGKEYVKAIYCHSAYLNLYAEYMMWNQAGWITSWNQNCSEKYQQAQICRWYHSNDRKWRGTIEPLNEDQRREWINWLGTQHEKN